MSKEVRHLTTKIELRSAGEGEEKRHFIEGYALLEAESLISVLLLFLWITVKEIRTNGAIMMKKTFMNAASIISNVSLTFLS